MSYALSQPLNASGHQDDAVRGNYSKKVSTELTRPVAVEKSPELKTVPERRFQINNTTLSFAYDAVGKSLNIVMTDASICGLGQAAPNPVRCVQKYFSQEIA